MTLILQDTLVISPKTKKELEKGIADVNKRVDDLEGASDVADIVDTYAELLVYDTSSLTDKAIIKVLEDETHDDRQSYYRWDLEEEQFEYIGALEPYYTKTETDELLAAKQNRPNSAVQGNIATFNGTKDTIDSGKSFTTSIATSENASDDKIPTEKAARTELDTKQETLVNQVNIKSINGNSLLGSGNLELTQYLGFPADWPTTSSSTTKQFCDVVAADVDAIEGKMYLGEVRWSDLNTVGLVNAEVAVSIMKGSTTQSKVIVLRMTSGNHAPYQWQYTYWNGGSNVSGWIGFQPELPKQSGQSGKFLTTNGSTLSWGTVDLSTKVDKVNQANKIYGTDANGAQTVYDAGSLINGYLGLWDSVHASSTPAPATGYAYHSGDYFIVDAVTEESIAIEQTQYSEESGAEALENLSVDLAKWKEKVEPTGDLVQEFEYIDDGGESVWALDGEALEGEISDYGITFDGVPFVGDALEVTYVATHNYKPTGSTYPGSAVETKEVAENDLYIYDGSSWRLLKTSEQITQKIETLETTIEELQETKLDVDQGISEAGKIMMVGADGNLTLANSLDGGFAGTLLINDNDEPVRLPAAPLSQGAYVLRAVVDENGVATYSWVAE